MGSRLFTRAHPVLDGLPHDGAMKSYHQVPVGGADGLVDGGE